MRLLVVKLLERIFTKNFTIAKIYPRKISNYNQNQKLYVIRKISEILHFACKENFARKSREGSWLLVYVNILFTVGSENLLLVLWWFRYGLLVLWWFRATLVVPCFSMYGQNNNKQDEPFRFIETTEREEALGTRLSGHIHLMLGQ